MTSFYGPGADQIGLSAVKLGLFLPCLVGLGVVEELQVLLQALQVVLRRDRRKHLDAHRHLEYPTHTDSRDWWRQLW